MRYLLELSYDGTNYNGWQSQPTLECTIQHQIESKLSNLLGVKINVIASGRTDTGVHAKQMVAHFDHTGSIELSSFKHRLNNYLPSDIAVANIRDVPVDFHARFSATKRTYLYKITTVKNPFLIHKAYLFKQSLDLAVMNQACKMLLEHTDFQCFSKVKTDVKHFECIIFKAHWEQKGQLILFEISANRFLRNMVRAIVGTLLEIGQGKISVDDLKKILESKNRSMAGASAPAHGLYLEKIEYPESSL